jgi:hypothetical protein
MHGGIDGFDPAILAGQHAAVWKRWCDPSGQIVADGLPVLVESQCSGRVAHTRDSPIRETLERRASAPE